MSRRGFTLLEMMTAVAVAGILSSLAMISLTAATNTAKVSGDADVLANFMRNARLRSIAQGCPFVVRWSGERANLNPRSVMLYRKRSCQLGTPQDLRFDAAPVNGDIVINRYEPNRGLEMRAAGVDLTALTYYVGFNPLGAPMSGNSFSGSVAPMPAAYQLAMTHTRSTQPPTTLTLAVDGSVRIR